jgi:fumarate hydratase class II
MLATALSPVIGYDKTAQITHHALDKNLTLKQAAMDLGLVSEADFNRIVDPTKMTGPSNIKG